MNFELGKTYIVEVTENGIVPTEEFDESRWYDKDHDDLDFLTDEEKAVVVKERDKEWLKMIDNIIDAIWFETAKSAISKNTAIGIIRDITQLFTESHDVYETNCTHYDKTFIVDGFILHSERERMEYYIEEALKDVRAEIILLSDTADRECKASNSYSVRDRLRTKAQAYDDVAKMIDQKIKECTPK